MWIANNLTKTLVEGGLVKSRITFSPFAPNYDFPGFPRPQKILKKSEKNPKMSGDAVFSIAHLTTWSKIINLGISSPPRELGFSEQN